jgi:hypothetical protein
MYAGMPSLLLPARLGFRGLGNLLIYTMNFPDGIVVLTVALVWAGSLAEPDPRAMWNGP